MTIYRCRGCALNFDKQAYEHHFQHDHCEERNDVPLPLLVCDRHRDQCPLEDTALRRRQFGNEWPTRPPSRKCTPLYVLRAGYAYFAGQTAEDRYPHSWLALGGDAPAKARLRAPRPPALQEAQ